MNKDQAKGAVKEVAGKVQAQVGKATGSKEHQAKGTAREMEGKVQGAVGDVKKAAKDTGRKS